MNAARDRLAHAEEVKGARRLFESLEARLDALRTAGLGYLSLSRPAPSQPRGEGRRIRLAVSLVSALDGVVHVLDEPTVGLLAKDVTRLAGRVALAKVVASDMTGLAILMDEPSRGMHPGEVVRLNGVLR